MSRCRKKNRFEFW